MTDYEKLKQAQSDAFVESCDKKDVHHSPLAKEFFLAGWAAADAFADEQPQPVDNFDKFGKPEQLPTTPDREMMRFEAAKAAMQALLRNPDISDRYAVWSDVAHDAVVAANHLLAGLDKINKK